MLTTGEASRQSADPSVVMLRVSLLVNSVRVPERDPGGATTIDTGIVNGLPDTPGAVIVTLSLPYVPALRPVVTTDI